MTRLHFDRRLELKRTFLTRHTDQQLHSIR
jgi:hypothetical protein